MRVRLTEVAELLGGVVEGDGETVVTGLAPLAEAGPDDLSFVTDAKYAARLEGSRAGAVLIDLERDADRPAVRLEDPYLGFLRLLERYHPVVHPDWGIDPHAAIAETAELGSGTRVGPFATVEAGARLGDRVVVYPGVYVGESCEIGPDCVLYPNVTLYPGTRLGEGVIVHAGAVLGADGFGYHPRPDGSLRKIPQIGRVVVEDMAEVGANACVDRAMMGDTVVGTGTKLDNLVQVGHNCRIGPHSVLAGQAGLSGSVTTGSHVQMGGQVGVADHVTIGSGAALYAQSGIAGDVEPGAKVFGSPAVPTNQFIRAHHYTQRLGELFSQVKRLERLFSSRAEPGSG